MLPTLPGFTESSGDSNMEENDCSPTSAPDGTSDSVLEDDNQSPDSPTFNFAGASLSTNFIKGFLPTLPEGDRDSLFADSVSTPTNHCGSHDSDGDSDTTVGGSSRGRTSAHERRDLEDRIRKLVATNIGLQAKLADQRAEMEQAEDRQIEFFEALKLIPHEDARPRWEVDELDGKQIRPLYSDMISINRESTVSLLLCRADLKFILTDYDAMATHSLSALVMAGKLDYKPLTARCHFIHGIALYHKRFYRDALEEFQQSYECNGQYEITDERINEWCEGCADAMYGSPPQTSRKTTRPSSAKYDTAPPIPEATRDLPDQSHHAPAESSIFGAGVVADEETNATTAQDLIATNPVFEIDPRSRFRSTTVPVSQRIVPRNDRLVLDKKSSRVNRILKQKKPGVSRPGTSTGLLAPSRPIEDTPPMGQSNPQDSHTPMTTLAPEDLQSDNTNGRLGNILDLWGQGNKVPSNPFTFASANEDETPHLRAQPEKNRAFTTSFPADLNFRFSPPITSNFQAAPRAGKDAERVDRPGSQDQDDTFYLPPNAASPPTNTNPAEDYFRNQAIELERYRDDRRKLLQSISNTSEPTNKPTAQQSSSMADSTNPPRLSLGEMIRQTMDVSQLNDPLYRVHLFAKTTQPSKPMPAPIPQPQFQPPKPIPNPIPPPLSQPLPQPLPPTSPTSTRSSRHSSLSSSRQSSVRSQPLMDVEEIMRIRSGSDSRPTSKDSMSSFGGSPRRRVRGDSVWVMKDKYRRNMSVVREAGEGEGGEERKGDGDGDGEDDE